MKKIGILLGSFNPITNAHLEIANSSLEFVDEVWFIVSPQNPHKNLADLVDEKDRLKMVKMSIKDNPKFIASNIEFNLPKPSFTINTINTLEKKFKYDFYIISGTDSINTIRSWKDSNEIINKSKFIVYVRDNESLCEELEGKVNIAYYIKSNSILSSTIVRNMIRDKKVINGLIPSDVETYIQLKGLYS
jgi:nicotinate-nucleotide adenylyltransferase